MHNSEEIYHRESGEGLGSGDFESENGLTVNESEANKSSDYDRPTTITLKIGGASMSKVNNEVRPIAETAIGENDKVAVVVSAFENVTQISLDLINGVRLLFEDFKKNGISHPEKLEDLMSTLRDPICGVIDRNLEGYAAAILVMNKYCIDGIEEIQNFIYSILMLAQTVARDTFENLLDDAKNMILAFGERISAMTLAEIIPDCELLDLTDILERGKEMTIDTIRERVGQAALLIIEEGKTPIIPGYLGNGTMDLLGRGYTEATAAMVSTWMAEKDEDGGLHIMDVWKDVVLSSGDPRRLKGREKPVKRLSEAEIVEAVGAGKMKALNEVALQILLPHDVLLRLRNTAKPDDEGTVISRTRPKESDVSVAQSINVKDGVTMVSVKSNKMISNQGEGSKGFVERIGAVAKGLGISIDIISTSANTIAFTFDGNINGNSSLPENIRKLLEDRLNQVDDIDSVEIECEPLSSIVLVGDQFKEDEFKGVIAMAEFIIRVKLGIDVKLRSQATLEAMSFVVPTKNADAVLCVLHRVLVEETKAQFIERRNKMMEAFGDIGVCEEDANEDE